MNKKDFKFIFIAFAAWRIFLFVIVYFAIKFIPLQSNFLGGGMGNYLSNPYFWSWINFDGEHYLAIAQQGYQSLTYFFFPVYPKLIFLLGNIFGKDLVTLGVLGLIISNVSFLVALIGLWKLIRLDFKEDIAKLTIILMLLFPTSLFFGAYYTESLFLALVVWSFYLARSEKWFLASMLTSVATATRVIGVAIIAALTPLFLKKKRWEILIMPVGIVIYMYYLYIATGDPLNFFNSVSIFGQQRSTGLVFLPQVFYRYIFKVLPNVNYFELFLAFTPLLEFIVATLFLVLSVVSFFRLKLDYSLYLALGYLIPTFSGSFSSLPRYVLILFPGFILLSLYMFKIKPILRVVVCIALLFTLIISTAMFVRGFWIS